MVTRKRILAIAGLLSALLIGLSLVWFLRDPARISHETSHRSDGHEQTRGHLSPRRDQ